MQRFELLYEKKRPADLTALFTADYRFYFSVNADPVLVSKYPAGWTREDEDTSATHLYQGFVDAGGQSEPAATAIELVIDPYDLVDDRAPDSTAYYKTYFVPSVLLGIEFASVGAITTVEGRHKFWLVRGDAAHLTVGQPADSTHWYIYEWQDQTPPLIAAPLASAAVTSWGRLKAEYR